MASRSFTVFQDTPSAGAPSTKPVSSLARQTSILGTKLIASNSLASLNTDDKENLHPLTGERNVNASSNTKKRKTTALAVKAVTSSLAKKKSSKEKEVKESTGEESSPTKKRKSTSSSVRSKVSVKKDSKKDSRLTSTTARKRPTRKAPPMPKVDEEAESEKKRISQAEIDSRCYELTVRPLADVSRAYDQGGSLETLVDEEENVKVQSLKASSVEPEIRERFLSPLQFAALPLSSRHTSPAPTSTAEARTFSTPERKKIYAAFTFTSPSPTSKRFSELNRVSDIPPLEIA